MANQTKLSITIDANGNAAIRVLDQTEKKAASFTKKVKENWLAISAAALIAQQTISRGINLAKLSDQYDQNRRSFNLMVRSMGRDADVEFAKIRKASGGLIDKNALVESANRAISLGLPIDKLGNLMEIARAKARDMGITTTQAFSDIATGIGRASPMILDNLGLTIKIGEANQKYAASLNKTVGALTAQEKQQAITNAVIESGTEAIKRQNLAIITNAERWQLWEAQITNSRIAVGNFIKRVAVGLTAVFQFLSAGLLGIGEFIGKGFQTFLSLGLSAVSTILEFVDPVLKMLTSAAEITDALNLTEGAADKLRKTTAFTELLAEGFAKESAKIAKSAGETGSAWAAAEDLTAKAAENMKLALATHKDLDDAQVAARKRKDPTDTGSEANQQERLDLLQEMQTRADEIGLEADVLALMRLDASHEQERKKLLKLGAFKTELAQAELIQIKEREALITEIENAEFDKRLEAQEKFAQDDRQVRASDEANQQERLDFLQGMQTRADEIGLEADVLALMRLDAKHTAEMEKLVELGAFKAELAQAEVLQIMEREALITEIEKAELDKRVKAQEAAAQAEQQIRSSAISNTISLLNLLGQRSKIAALAAIALSKGQAIAQTIQFGAAAQIRALAELGPVAGPPAAAGIKFWTAANVALIAATGLGQAAALSGGGAGGGAGGAGAPGVVAPPAVPERVQEDREPKIIVQVFNQGSVISEAELSRQVFDNIQKLQQDGLPNDTTR